MPLTAPQTPRVALVHDWLTGMRGGEKVLLEICRLFPQADLLTLLHVQGSCDGLIENRTIRTSFLNRLPLVRHYYRHLLPWMPRAISRLDASRYDLIISTSHCVAKGVGSQRDGQLHVCYCFTPMRYIWAVEQDYRRSLGLSGLVLRALTPRLRAWDRRAADNVDLFLADSVCVADRIRHAYGRDSCVLYPSADVNYYTPSAQAREDFYLVVSALGPYKRADLAVAAASSLGRPLKIIGTGPEMSKLKRQAGRNVEFLGWQNDTVLRDNYRRCRALLFPQLEDFGIVPLEASACGCPVIAYAGGGALETVRDAADSAVANPTGLLFSPQTADGLADAICRFESPQMCGRFDPAAMRQWAERFGSGAFAEGFKKAVEPLMAGRGLATPW